MSTKINQSQLIDQTFKKIKEEYPELVIKHVVSKGMITDIIRIFFKLLKLIFFEAYRLSLRDLSNSKLSKRKHLIFDLLI